MSKAEGRRNNRSRRKRATSWGKNKREGENLYAVGYVFSDLGAVLVMVLIPFARDNFCLMLFGLLPLALGLGLMLIYLFMQEGSLSDEKPAKG